jgi:hypothetical protein
VALTVYPCFETFVKLAVDFMCPSGLTEGTRCNSQTRVAAKISLLVLSSVPTAGDDSFSSTFFASGGHLDALCSRERLWAMSPPDRVEMTLCVLRRNCKTGRLGDRFCIASVRRNRKQSADLHRQPKKKVWLSRPAFDSMPLEAADQLRLRASYGNIELGLFEEANAELEEIDPFCRHLPEVLVARLAAYHGLKKWDLLTVVAKQPDGMESERAGPSR